MPIDARCATSAAHAWGVRVLAHRAFHHGAAWERKELRPVSGRRRRLSYLRPIADRRQQRGPGGDPGRRRQCRSWYCRRRGGRRSIRRTQRRSGWCRSRTSGRQRGGCGSCRELGIRYSTPLRQRVHAVHVCQRQPSAGRGGGEIWPTPARHVCTFPVLWRSATAAARIFASSCGKFASLASGSLPTAATRESTATVGCSRELSARCLRKHKHHTRTLLHARQIRCSIVGPW
jgi:hypothetical protein